MKKIRSYIIDYFGFSKTEANATIVLVAIIIFVGIVPRTYLKYHYSHHSLDFENDKGLEKWHKEVQKAFVKKKEEKAKSKLSRFDPNTSTVEELIALGFKSYVAERIEKYRAAGGVFRTSKDLKRIYGVDPKLLDELEKYVNITPSLTTNYDEEDLAPSFSREGYSVSKEEKLIIFDLNMAKEKDLEKIKGIGPYYAKRIVKYRNALGGFASMQQLQEVYGIKKEMIDALNKQSKVVVKNRKSIPINSDSIKSLAKHPYLDWNQARAIVNYRKLHGEYKSSHELKEIKIISDSLYQKISPYLSIQPIGLNAPNSPILPTTTN